MGEQNSGNIILRHLFSVVPILRTVV